MENNRTAQNNLLVIWLLAGWFIINLVQAAITPLHGDEAYYWTYGWHLDFGYWDNAPLIGVFTALGELLLPGTTLGVRLLSVMATTAALWVLWLLTDRRDPLLFFALCMGMLLFHAGGFMASPDAPLALSNAFFLLAFKRFTERKGWMTALLLGLTIAFVFYSKYQGIMLVGMMLVTGTTHWKNRYFPVALLVAALLCAPGLNWLWENDFGTFRHHLGGKDPEGWQPVWTLSFLGGQIASAGPITAIVLFVCLFLPATNDRFIRQLRWSVFGIYLFLLFLTTKTVVHGNWAAPALLILPLIAYQQIQRYASRRNLVIRLAAVNLALIMAVRIYLVSGAPLPAEYKKQFVTWKPWAESIQAIAGDHPVVFLNSFQFPSRYAFETGNRLVWCNSNPLYHPSNYWMHGFEEQIQGEDVLFVHPDMMENRPAIDDSTHGAFRYGWLHDFKSYQRLNIETEYESYQASRGDTITMKLNLDNPYPYPVDLSPTPDYSFVLGLFIRKEGKDHMIILLEEPELDDLVIQNSAELVVELPAGLEASTYSMQFSLCIQWDMPYFGSDGSWFSVTITD